MSVLPRYLSIAAHYEACLERHGDTHRGVDWPTAEEVEIRHHVMLEVMRPFPPVRPTRLLDFGCGASHLYETIQRNRLDQIEYVGLDISEQFVELSRRKFPANRYMCADVLTATPGELPRADYAVMSGVFTQKLALSFDEMLDFFTATVSRVFSLVEHGIAFNLISPHLEGERDELFHLPVVALTEFLADRISRSYVIRNDYEIDYEHTIYAYHSGPSG